MVFIETFDNISVCSVAYNIPPPPPPPRTRRDLTCVLYFDMSKFQALSLFNFSQANLEPSSTKLPDPLDKKITPLVPHEVIANGCY